MKRFKDYILSDHRCADALVVRYSIPNRLFEGVFDDVRHPGRDLKIFVEGNVGMFRSMYPTYDKSIIEFVGLDETKANLIDHGYVDIRLIELADTPYASSIDEVYAAMCESAVSGSFSTFETFMPDRCKHTHHLYNEIRVHHGKDPVSTFTDNVKFSPISNIREMYVHGEIFNVGDTASITKTGDVVTIVERKTNYVVVDGGKKIFVNDLSPILDK